MRTVIIVDFLNNLMWFHKEGSRTSCSGQCDTSRGRMIDESSWEGSSSAAYLISSETRRHWLMLRPPLWYDGAYISCRHAHTCKCTHKSNTASFSQEIIAVINILARSLTAALIGWKSSSEAALCCSHRNFLKDWNHPNAGGTRRHHQPVLVYKHSCFPQWPCPCISSPLHTSFVRLDLDLSTLRSPAAGDLSPSPIPTSRINWTGLWKSCDS